MKNYSMSKTGNLFLAIEAARRWGPESSIGSADGIVSVAQNPGQIDSRIYRHVSPWIMMAVRPTMYQPRVGAYTLLFAGLSPDVSLETNGADVLPFGRLQERSTRKDITKAIEEGRATEFWNWCEDLFNKYI